LQQLAIIGTIVVGLLAGAEAAERRNNLILFVPDGLRALSVDPEVAPALAALRDAGVWFKNSHSLFPTFTTANASAMATGHHLGDTGDYSNTLYVARPMAAAGGTVTPFIENDRVLGELDEQFGGDYLNETTVLAAARAQGYSTVTIGKLGPALIFDHTNRSGEPTIVLDDATGHPNGIVLPKAVIDGLNAAALPLAAPGRGANGRAGDAMVAGTTAANVEQQRWFVEVTTKVVLPLLKGRGHPFVLVYWSRDPDGTQHNQGDSLHKLTPGINGPTARAAIRNADDNLRALQDALRALDLAETTNIVVAADHGFSTISKESATSPAARDTYKDVPPGFLPPGFLALDLGTALGLPLFDPNDRNLPVAPGEHPRNGNGLLGANPARPDVVVAANGGSDLIYLPGGSPTLARRVVEALLAQDYTGGLFVDDGLGRFPGTLPLSAIGLRGAGVTPRPAIAITFRSFATDCAEPLLCGVAVADAGLQQGQGMHGSFSRADTNNFMAALGPDFKRGFVDPAPASNADVGRTIIRLLDLKIADKGSLVGRVLAEALPGGALPRVTTHRVEAPPAAGGLATVLDYQLVGATRYLTAAGIPGRTLGLNP
jgi:arylsulfatase A-like enzyme